MKLAVFVVTLAISVALSSTKPYQMEEGEAKQESDHGSKVNHACSYYYKFTRSELCLLTPCTIICQSSWSCGQWYKIRNFVLLHKKKTFMPILACCPKGNFYAQVCLAVQQAHLYANDIGIKSPHVAI